MVQPAQVTSVDAIEAFRASLIVYLAKARSVLEEISAEVQHTRQWVGTYQRLHVENQLRSRLRKLEEAQEALFNARLSQFSPSIKIRLTERDKSLQDSYIKISGEMTQLSYQGFEASEIDRFEDFLARILENLKVEEKKEETP